MVCRVFKKKNYHKALESPSASNTHPRNDAVLDQILMYMGKSSSCKQELDPNIHFPNISPPFLHLPELESPTMHPPLDPIDEIGPSSDWATLDRLVASQLNGQSSKQFDEDFSFSFDHQLMNMHDSSDHHRPNENLNGQDVSSSETDLWNFARSSSSLSSSSSDPLCHLSV